MKVAVIGSGISGLSAAWLLSKSDKMEVSLFEAQNYFGGHSNTVDVLHKGVTHPVDTGFLVHNPNTYPNLLALFEALNVKTIETDMSFSVKIMDEDIEWAGTNLWSVFANKKNLFRPRFWRMILDIMRFNKSALRYLELAKKNHMTLGQLLKIEKYSEEMKNWYLIPMGAAIWSSSTEEMLGFPAENFIQFCLNHSLLQVEGRPKWRTVAGGSKVYVAKMIEKIQKAHLNEPVVSVIRATNNSKITVTTSQREEIYDKVIFACHSDQILKIFKSINDEEKSLLSKVRYQKNQAYLHWDQALLPDSKQVWSAWNYTSQTDQTNQNAVTVTYLINKLQPLPFEDPIMVTLNPIHLPDENKTFKVIEYEHPVFDQPAIDAQKKLSTIQNKNNALFAGAWCGYGFHEDGLKAGISAANILGVKASWQK